MAKEPYSIMKWNVVRRDFLKAGSAALFASGNLLDLHAAERPFPVCIIGNDSDHQFFTTLVSGIDGAVIAAQDEASAAIVTGALQDRGEQAHKMLAAGLHVLAESPPAVSYDEFDGLMRVANTQNLRLGIGCYHRYLDSVVMARNLIWQRIPGNPISMNIRIGDSSDDPLLNRFTEGYLGRALPLLDLARWIGGKSPEYTTVEKNLFAEFVSSPSELSLMADMGGVPVTCHSGGIAGPESAGGWSLDIHCTEGMLRLDGTGSLVRSTGGEWTTLHSGTSKSYTNSARVLVQDFIVSCRTGKEPEVNALDGMSGLALTLAAVQSAQSGSTISMVIQPRTKDSDRIWAQEQRRRNRQ
jgi:predicted dehydrogenase